MNVSVPSAPILGFQGQQGAQRNARIVKVENGKKNRAQKITGN